MQHAHEIDPVLDEDRPIEAVFDPQLLEALRVDAALARERLDRIAGHEANEEKGQHGDSEKGRNDEADACQDESEHLLN